MLCGPGSDVLTLPLSFIISFIFTVGDGWSCSNENSLEPLAGLRHVATPG